MLDLQETNGEWHREGATEDSDSVSQNIKYIGTCRTPVGLALRVTRQDLAGASTLRYS